MMARAVVRRWGWVRSSARVNEVAKLCRAVVHGMEGGCAPKVRLPVLGESSMSDLLMFWIAEDKSRELDGIDEPIDR